MNYTAYFNGSGWTFKKLVQMDSTLSLPADSAYLYRAGISRLNAGTIISSNDTTGVMVATVGTISPVNKFDSIYSTTNTKFGNNIIRSRNVMADFGSWNPGVNPRTFVITGSSSSGNIMIGNNGSVASGDVLGQLLWGDTTSKGSSAGIKAYIVVKSSGADTGTYGYGGKMSIYTKQDGDILREALSLYANGWANFKYKVFCDSSLKADTVFADIINADTVYCNALSTRSGPVHFDQDLRSTDDVVFNKVNTKHLGADSISVGVLEIDSLSSGTAVIKDGNIKQLGMIQYKDTLLTSDSVVNVESYKKSFYRLNDNRTYSFTNCEMGTVLYVKCEAQAGATIRLRSDDNSNNVTLTRNQTLQMFCFDKQTTYYRFNGWKNQY
jgi:hypothetical protein